MAAITVLAEIPRTHAAVHYTGKLNVKFMIQQRQFRREHEDSHYAAAILRYDREYATHVMEHARLLCIDDKQGARIGKLGFPVADTSFEVGDHDFTKFSPIPSVVL